MTCKILHPDNARAEPETLRRFERDGFRQYERESETIREARHRAHESIGRAFRFARFRKNRQSNNKQP